MEIIGSLHCRVNYNLKNIALSMESFGRSKIPEKIKEKFSFSEMKIERDIAIWQAGMFTYDSKEIIVGQATLDTDSNTIGTVVVGSSDDAKAFLDSVCKFIDGFRVFDTLCDAEKDVYYGTVGRAKINVSPFVFISKDYIEFMKERKKIFETQYYTAEIQPIAFAVAVVLKPNLSEMSRQALDVTEMTNIMRGGGVREITLSIQSVEDFNNRIYNFMIRIDSGTVKKLLADLETQLASQ